MKGDVERVYESRESAGHPQYTMSLCARCISNLHLAVSKSNIFHWITFLLIVVPVDVISILYEIVIFIPCLVIVCIRKFCSKEQSPHDDVSTPVLELESDHFSLLTWNIWNVWGHYHQRMPIISEKVAETNANILCLQEVQQNKWCCNKNIYDHLESQGYVPIAQAEATSLLKPYLFGGIFNNPFCSVLHSFQNKCNILTVPIRGESLFYMHENCTTFFGLLTWMEQTNSIFVKAKNAERCVQSNQNMSGIAMSTYRSATKIKINTNKGSIILVNTHLTYGDENASTQELKEILEWVEDDKVDGYVIAGDFNQDLCSKAMEFLFNKGFKAAKEEYSYAKDSMFGFVTERGNHNLQFGGDESDGKNLDHIMLKNLKVKSLEYVKRKVKLDDYYVYASDHPGIFATLELLDPERDRPSFSLGCIPPLVSETTETID